MFLPDDIGPDDCYVPAGWVPLGGDPLAADAAPRTLAWIDGFVLRRFPVTVEEYGHFLRSLPSDEAARWNPPLDPTSTHPDSPRLFEADGVLRSGLASGAPRTPRHPIAHLSGRAASRYVAWLADCTGEAWRLPTEWEREKAARGPEGRAFPWGDHLEADWACWLGCHPGPPIPEPVGSHPYDESVYGVRGLAGHVRDACANEWERAPRLVDGRVAWTPARSVQAVRGGAWRAAPYLCRAAARFGGDPDTWTGVVGVRPCRSVSPETRRSTP